MPLQMPWTKRRNEIESREGCEGTWEYSWKAKNITSEFLRIHTHIAKAGKLDQRRYSYLLGLIQEQKKLNLPPAATELNRGLALVLESTRDNMRQLDAEGNQTLQEVELLIAGSFQAFEESCRHHMDCFNDQCFSREPGK